MKATPRVAMMSPPSVTGYVQVAFVHILQQEKDYRDAVWFLENVITLLTPDQQAV
jgi:hypothetical protein